MEKISVLTEREIKEINRLMERKSEIVLEDEFRKVSDKYVLMSDDGTAGEKGLVTDALKRLIDGGEKYDEVIAIGPVIMMKFVCRLTKEYGVKTKFACVDGPDFDGHEVDFDEAMSRGASYKEWERHKYEETCNLFNKEVK